MALGARGDPWGGIRRINLADDDQRNYDFGNNGRDSLGVSTHSVVLVTKWSMRRAVRQYLRPYTWPTPWKAGGVGIKRPWYNGQDKGMAYPCQKICKEPSTTGRHTREVPDRRANH